MSGRVYLKARGHTLFSALRAALRAVALSHARLRTGVTREVDSPKAKTEGETQVAEQPLVFL